MALTRRAHDLGLPFHLPLYQRLMEVTAAAPAVSDATNKTRLLRRDVVDTILEIASFTDTLHHGAVPVHASLFRPALLVLIRDLNFLDTVQVLCGMRDRHGLAVLDRHTAADLYVTLHAVTRDMVVLDETTGNVREHLLVMTEIVAMLEGSIVALSNEWEKDAKEANEAREAKETEESLIYLLDRMDSEDVNDIVTSIEDIRDTVDEEGDDDEEDEDFVSRDDDDGDDNDSDSLSGDEELNHFLTQRVKSEKAKATFAKLVRWAHVSRHNVPRIINVKVRIDTKSGKTVIQKDDWASDYDSDEDERSERAVRRWLGDESCLAGQENNRIADDQGRVDRELTADQVRLVDTKWNRFPDVTAQIVLLNNGRSLMFTRRFEEILWKASTMEEHRFMVDKNFLSDSYSDEDDDLEDEEDDSEDEDDTADDDDEDDRNDF